MGAPFIAARGSGTKAVGAVGRRCSDRVPDRWVPCGFTFFQNLSEPDQTCKIEIDVLSCSKNSQFLHEPSLEYSKQRSQL
jgi:hypothetical protein